MATPPEVLPKDEHNAALLANLHPADWRNPEPVGRYNLLVVGGGPAGLVAAAGAAGLGATVALVENHLLGGDCLNVGCVPSKALIRASRALAELRESEALGLAVPARAEEQFAAAAERMRRLRAQLSRHDSAARFQELGVDVFLGQGRFTGPAAFQIDGKTIRFAKAAVCTGARADVPPIKGLAEAGFLTNETLFTLTERPARMAIIGGGPIGCEMAQTFARFGTRVTLLQISPQFLPREDPDAAVVLAQAFERDGVDVRLNTKTVRVAVDGETKQLHVETDGRPAVAEADQILVAAGRAPNVENLGLEAAGIEYDPRRGIRVDDHLRTTNPNVYSAGDVCMRYQFTHAADAAARIVIQNALFLGRKKLSALNVPWCTYTAPEIAHVGLYEHEARERGIELDTFETLLAEVDRAVCDGETEGFVKIHVRKGKDQILGATIVASHAGDLIGEVCVAMAAGFGLGSIAGVIHPYPTQAEAIKRTGDAYNRTRLTPLVTKIMKRWLAWRR